MEMSVLYRYGVSDRRRQLVSALEASGRTLVDRGTVLVVDISDPCSSASTTTDPAGQPDTVSTPRTDTGVHQDPLAVYRDTRLAYDCCGLVNHLCRLR